MKGMNEHKKEKYRIIGERIPYIDAKEKVTGRTRYVTDIKLPGTLVGKALRSPYAHAKILNIDTTEARKVAGVKTIITAKDIDQQKWGPITKDQFILAKDKVRYVGDEVAAVAAMDVDACDEALAKIKVDYEILPAVFSAFEAMQPGAPSVHDGYPNNINQHMVIPDRGDVEEAFRKADFVLEDVYQTHYHYQAYMEPMGGISVWDQNCNLTIYAGIQTPTWSRRDYAVALGIPVDKIQIIQPYYGGSFGAKLSQQVHPLGAVLAKHAVQPVRFVLSRDEDFQCGLPRVPMRIHLKTAWSSDGSFLAKDVYILADNGAYSSYAAAICSTAMYRIDILYKVPVLRSVCDLVYTNKVPTGCYRGFGNAQMHYALETHIDQVGKEIDIDPVELRRKNLAGPNYKNPHGWKLNSCEIQECLNKAIEDSEFVEKKKKFAVSNAKEKSPIKRGIGVAVCVHVSGNRTFIKEFEGAAVLIRLNDQGRPYVYSNEPDMGQGIRTLTSMCVAEVLGFDLEDVQVPDPDTNVVPFGLGIFSSRGSYMVGGATKNSALDLKNKLIKTASKLMHLPEEELFLENKQVVWSKDKKKSLSYQDISWNYICANGGQMMQGIGYFTPPEDVAYPDDKKYGNASGGYGLGCHIAEVEVNTETGQVRVPNIWAIHDVGQPINLLTVEGQIDGGIAQGYGWALMEKMVFNSEGKVRNASFLDYQIPTAGDVPTIHSGVVDSFEWTTGFGSKSVGEAALIAVVPAIGNAIFNATGVRLKEIPMTAEKVLSALQEKKRKEAR